MPIRFAFLTAFVLFALTFVSCHDDDGPPFIHKTLLTTYTGTLFYTNRSTNESIGDTAGTATIEYTGDSYSVHFSNDVPSITDLVFMNMGGEYVSINASNSVLGVTLDDPNLEVAFAFDNGESIGFSGSK